MGATSKMAIILLLIEVVYVLKADLSAFYFIKKFSYF